MVSAMISLGILHRLLEICSNLLVRSVAYAQKKTYQNGRNHQYHANLQFSLRIGTY
jgi:hypothetical protein